MAYYRINNRTGEREEIPQDEFLSLQKQSKSQREDFIPNLLQAFKSRGSEIATLGKPTEKPPEYSPTLGGQLGQLIGTATADVPAYAAAGLTGGLPALAGLLGYGYATSSGDTSAERAQQALMIGAPAAIPFAKKATKAANEKIKDTQTPKFESIKEIAETLKKPERISAEIEEIKPQKEASKLSEKQMSEDFSKNIDEAIFNKEKTIESMGNNLSESLGLGDLETSRSGLADSVSNVADELQQKNQNNYNEFSKSHGQELIKNPIGFNTIERDYGIGKGVYKVAPEIKPMIEKLKSPDTIGSNLGMAQEIRHTANEYLALYRALRDKSYSLSEDSRKAIGAEKSQLRKASQSLNALKNDVVDVMRGSLSENGLQSLDNAQAFYGDYVSPLREHAPTKSIIKDGKVPNNYFDSLNQPNTDRFMKRLLDNEMLTNAMSKHWLSQKNILDMTPNRLFDLLKSDQGRALPKNIRQSLAEYAGHKHDANMLKKTKQESASKSTQEPSNAVLDVLKSYPEFEKPFKDLKDVQKRTREFERLLMQKGLDKVEAEKAASKYFKIVSAAKTVKGIKSALKKAFFSKTTSKGF